MVLGEPYILNPKPPPFRVVPSEENLIWTPLPPPQVVPSKENLLGDFLEEVAGKEEAQLMRMINESEEVAKQRDEIKKRLTLLQRAAKEVAAFI